MMGSLRGNLTYANVMATIAVFIALGGASYAATQLPKNSVGTKQLKQNAVTTSKIKDGAVTGAKLELSTLGTVPSATRAASAENATRAMSAENATRATSAGSADTAIDAGNAQALDGSPATSFMRSDRFAFGTADTDAPTDQPLFQIAGIEVTTVGSSGTTFMVHIRNNTTDTWEFGNQEKNSVYVIAANGSINIETTTTRAMLIIGRNAKNRAKAVVIQCGSDNGPDILDCFAQASPTA